MLFFINKQKITYTVHLKYISYYISIYGQIEIKLRNYLLYLKSLSNELNIGSSSVISLDLHFDILPTLFHLSIFLY